MKIHFKNKKQLKHKMDELFCDVTSLLNKTREVIQTGTVLKAESVISMDDQINEQELDIVEGCIAYIALYNPVASTLRYVISSLHISDDLERIADYGVLVSKRILLYQNNRDQHENWILNEPLKILMEMLDWGIDMLNKSMEAFFEKKLELVEHVIEMDEQLDKIHRQANHMFLQMMSQSKQSPEEVLLMIEMSRALERLGDHVVHICYRCRFYLTGQL